MRSGNEKAISSVIVFAVGKRPSPRNSREGVAAVDHMHRDAVDDCGRMRRRAEYGLEQRLGTALCAALFRLIHLPLDRGGEPRHPVFQQIVGGAEAHQTDGRVLPDRAGDDDERDVEPRVAQELQRIGSAEAREVIVADDRIPRAVAQRRHHLLPRLDAAYMRDPPFAPKREHHVRRIAFGVFDEKEAEGFGHAADSWLPVVK